MIRRSIMIQISVAVVVITTITLSVFGVYRFKVESATVHRQLEKTLAVTLKRMSISLRTPLFNYAEDEIRSIILSEMDNPSIQAIMVTEPNAASPRYSYSRDTDGSLLTASLLKERQNMISASRNVLYEGENLGEVSVFMTTALSDQYLQDIIVSNIIQILLLDLTLIFLVIIFMKSRFVRPVTELTKAVAQITHGDLEAHIAAGGRDEIGTLASSFLKMRNAIQQQIIDLNTEIKERKHAEQQTHHLRNLLSNIINSMPSILIGIDRNCRVTHWNLEAENVTAVTADQAAGNPLKQVFPSLSGEMDRITTAIKKGTIQRNEKVRELINGHEIFSDITVYPLFSNGIVGAVIRIDNITERVRMEEMMIQSEKMLSVGGLAAGMAHEINNPLSGIMQNASLLENRLSADLPANLKAAETAGISMASIQHYMELRDLPNILKRIHTSGSMAASIVRNMLSFARKGDSSFSSRDLGALLDQTIELVKTDYDIKKNYDFKQIQIKREYDDDAPPVLCEASKIQQVFMNILKNGAEAMAEAVNGSQAASKFILRLVNDGDRARVEIEDNGPGMDENTRRRVFEPFFTTKSPGKGTGLGLSVSYFIITENHGGTMDVKSEIGQGSTFIITLPADEGQLDAEDHLTEPL